ncbi:ATP-binding protein [Sphingobacterium alkalisoli]|uniref:ATP-binding protein n=1 Tax=Sphingobacterium alkalisoli TaxID=1874115 RepID=A0A4U0GRX1_9SPHI|nr:ATP-binding protein [Sphingobacterium alkalisoli]TJY61506.1 ATP-binding protein [Sphingobacterium alkalisoli]GGH29972.1 ATPase [Sphingobacterium alkalisoli]
MKFYNRHNELVLLESNLKRSVENACFQAIIGRRRVGKTSLLIESVKGKKYLYLFVSRKNENLLCQQFQKDAEQMLGLRIFGTVSSFRNLFEQLLLFAAKEHFTLIIDEFQEFENVNPSIFSDIQNLWDQYKAQAKINLIVCGSVYSLMTKIFEHNKEPLFGRLTSKMIVQPFKVNVIKEILRDYNPDFEPEDLLCLYMVSGGVAKYIELLMDAGAVTKDQMLDMIARSDSPFLGEGKDILITEFGKEYGTYFSILQLIASGKNTQSEIDSIIEKNTGSYLNNLEEHYSLIVRNKPMFSKPNSRKSRWSLKDHYLSFWFRFIYPHQSLIEIGRLDLLREFVSKGYEQYSGLILEQYFREKISLEERVTEIGNFWDSKGQNEIDIVALNHLDKTATLAEVKRNPKKIDLRILEQKSKALQKELALFQVRFLGLSMEDM